MNVKRLLLQMTVAAVAVLPAGRCVEAAPETGAASSPETVWSALSGGDGGKAFEAHCGKDSALVGIGGRLGEPGDARVFQIRAICSNIVLQPALGGQKSAHLSNSITKLDWFGSQQGEPFELVCPLGQWIIGSNFFNTSFSSGSVFLINRLEISCSDSLPDQVALPSKTLATARENVSFASASPFTCPAGTIAQAIRGRAGQWIDSLGIGCSAISGISQVPHSEWSLLEWLFRDERFRILFYVCLAALSVVALAVLGKFVNDPFGLFALRVAVAFVGGAVGYLLPGTLDLKLPFLQATGALAFAVLLYWKNPPALAHNKAAREVRKRIKAAPRTNDAQPHDDVNG